MSHSNSASSIQTLVWLFAAEWFIRGIKEWLNRWVCRHQPTWPRGGILTNWFNVENNNKIKKYKYHVLSTDRMPNVFSTPQGGSLDLASKSGYTSMSLLLQSVIMTFTRSLNQLIHKIWTRIPDHSVCQGCGRIEYDIVCHCTVNHRLL